MHLEPRLKMMDHMLVETNVNLPYKPLQLSWPPICPKCHGQQMPAHAMGCISEEEYCAWRIHLFSIEWYQACCVERDVTSSLKFVCYEHNPPGITSSFPVNGTRYREIGVLQYRTTGRLHSGLMCLSQQVSWLHGAF